MRMVGHQSFVFYACWLVGREPLELVELRRPRRRQPEITSEPLSKT